jgi:hypothetical protein
MGELRSSGARYRVCGLEIREDGSWNGFLGPARPSHCVGLIGFGTEVPKHQTDFQNPARLETKGVGCEEWEKEINERVAALYGL